MQVQTGGGPEVSTGTSELTVEVTDDDPSVASGGEGDGDDDRAPQAPEPDADTTAGPAPEADRPPEPQPESRPESRPEPRPEPRSAPRPQEGPPSVVPARSRPFRTRTAEPVDLATAAEYLRTEIAALSLRLEVPEVAAARDEREGLLQHLDDFLLPRLRRMDAPLLAVIGGSTGAGKSTLTNSLLRRTVSRSGVLRPTTRSPVLVHHPFDSGAFLSQRILPGLARVTSEAPEPMQPVDVNAPRVTALRLVPDEALAPGLAIVDAPDIDSVVEANRDLAVQLLSAADMWIFVTTAARYADAVPWEMLRQSVDRGISVAVVLDRVPPESMHQVRVHLATMLRDRGLANAPMFTIPETRIADGYLPAEAIAPLKAWLTRLARDRRAREVVVRRTLDGALTSLRPRALRLASAADAQAAAHATLQSDLDQVYAAARAELQADLVNGTVLRGEVLARWQEVVGAGQFFRNVDSAVNRARDRLAAALRDGPGPTEALAEALIAGLHALVRSALQAAVDEVGERWRRYPGGAGLLADRADLQSVAADMDVRLRHELQGWQAEVYELIRMESVHRRAAASIGVQSAATLLALVTTGAQAHDPDDGLGAAAGTATIAQRLLDAVFGGQAIRALAVRAGDDLWHRIDALIHAERGRLQVLLDGAGVQTGSGPGLRSAAEAVEEAH